MVTEARAKGERNPIVVEAAILIEANWQSAVRRNLAYHRVERARHRARRARSWVKPEQTEARIKAQLPD